MAGSDLASGSDRFVMLPNGPTLPIEPIVLALTLEERGFSLSRDGEDTLLVRPHQGLTHEDRRQILRWKPHLLALLDYCALNVQ
jgi:hypothetical protein